MIIPVILGLLVRLSLLFLDFGWDVNNHIVWAKDLWRRGFAGFYDTPSSEVYASLYPNYPPLSLYLFYLVYPLKELVFQLLWFINVTVPIFPSKLIFFAQSRAFEAGILKLLGVLADFGGLWLIYLFVKKLAGKCSKTIWFAAVAILFNPAVFYNSAYWGQIDMVPIVFALAAFYLLLFSRRALLSGVFFTLGLLVKPTILVYAPFYAVLFVQKSGFKNLIKTALIANLVFWLAFWPFAPELDFFFPYRVYLEKIMAAQSLPFVTNGAFNFWVLVTGFEGIKDTAPFVFGLSYRVFAWALTAIFYGLIIDRAFKLKEQTTAFVWGVFLCSLAAFLFLTKMHERYSILPLPFLFLAAVGKPRLGKWFWAMSFLSFLNLYHSWPVPRIEFVAGFLAYPPVYTALSFLNVLLFWFFLKDIVYKPS